MTKFISIFIIFFCAKSFAQNDQLFPDIRVTESDDRGITIEVRPEYIQNAKIVSTEGTFELPQFKSSSSRISDRPGSEDIRTRVISIALPSYQSNTVSIIGSDFQTITGFSLAPVPEQKIVDDMGTTIKSYKTNFISRQSFYPQQIVQLSNVGMVKNWLTANLIVAPYQYNAAEKTLRKYTRIVVRIDFGSRDFPFDQTGNDDWAKASLVNYSTAKRWITPTSFKKSTASNSMFTSGTWIKMEIVDDGMYKIDANYLRSVGIEPSSLTSITNIKIFGYDGKNIPESLGTIRPSDIPQLAVEYVDRDSNAKFDNDDYVLFYGQGINGWNYNKLDKEFTHYVNPYTFSNYYFLTVGAIVPIIEIQHVNKSSPSIDTVKQTLGKVFFDEEKYNFNQSGQLWVSPPMNANESKPILNKLPGWASGTTILYKYKLFSRATAAAEFIFKESDQVLGNASVSAMSDYELNEVTTSFALSIEGQMSFIPSPSLTDQRSNLAIKYSVNSSVASGFIDWIRIFYRQDLAAFNDQIVFDSPDTTATVEFALNGFSTSSVNIYEVSDVNKVRKISYDKKANVGSIVFNDILTTGSIKRYWVGTDAKYLSPKSATKVPNSNLHGFTGADFIIITHNDFKSEALRLKTHKESLPATKKLSTVVVDVDTVYNEFGIGMPDPVALRDFLKYAVDNWSVKPKYVLFFGDASYDFRSILKNDRSWVPTYQTLESNDKIDTYSSEDFFTCLDPNNTATVSIAHGRLTPRSLEQARLLVDRIIQYEAKPTRGTWKNVITIVADDLWTPDGDEYIHTTQAEALVVNSPKEFDVKRIYAETYPVVFTSAGRRRPDVRQAIIDMVNRGTLILNFTGHGNPKVWTHESILTLDDVRSQFTNNEKLTFIIAATCDWGRFEEAGEPSSAEEVMFNTKGGAIGVLSATRVVYSDHNAETNQQFYSKLFSNSSSIRLGDAYLLAKNELSNDFRSLVNKRKYFLMGDPTLRLAVPEGKLFVDSLVSETSTLADTIRALDKITIKGTVRDSTNASDVNYYGTALINVHDADVEKSISTIPGMIYNENGGIIYKGEASIKNGIMNTSFVVPKDIAYQNKNGRLAVYFSNTQSDGRGYTKNFIVGGTNNNFQPDSIGPEIQIYFDTTNFRSGDVVNENPTLIVSLKDSSGINSSVNSIGHRLEAWIDGSSKSVDLTDAYKGDVDSYQQGKAEYQLSGISQGSHSIKVRAWDVHNNSSSAELYFVVASSSGLSIQQLYNFPNPVSTTTSFTFQHNQLTPIDVTIHIYTVAGRRIHTIERFGVGERFVKIDWNRRDSDGDEVGNGIYFYKVIAKTVDGQFTSEAIGKLAVVR
ncbi:MAG: type IX secretion system sortase PorU [Bacteroidota bacterium]|nr:type IX secretion system sortase PorU [Bacteroidota bacterium]